MLLLPWVSKTEITGTHNTGFTFCLIPCFFILTSAYPEVLDSPLRQYSSCSELKQLVVAVFILKK